jgi:hypothetical protein
MKRLRVIALVFGILIADCKGQSTQPVVSPQPVSFTISAIDPVITAGSVVEVKVSLKNVADYDINADVKWTYLAEDFSYKFVIRNEAGAIVPEDASYLKRQTIFPFEIKSFVLRPGDVTEGVVDLIQYHLAPGQYRLWVERTIYRHSDTQHYIFVKSNEIAIKVLPKEDTAQ